VSEGLLLGRGLLSVYFFFVKFCASAHLDVEGGESTL
jgi:hypothetical protein